MKETNSTVAEIITSLGGAAAKVVGALTIAVFVCGPVILPWYKEEK